MLYRKYRPQTFSEIIGQEHVVQTLRGALLTGRVGHAYLFCGPRGTGKTTMARLLAKALNCDKGQVVKGRGEICNECESCQAINQSRSLDLVEIDAASQTGVDNIRELTDSAKVAAPSGRYKIFIVDEVHMLSKSAFNALLKILEEPPSHVIFILATTEPHKILATVLSRVQRFDFKRLLPRQIFSKLKQMTGTEKIKVDDGGLLAIAMASDGALRDAEVSLSKVISANEKNKEITEEAVYETLGLIPINYYPEFMGYLAGNDKNSAIDFVNNIYARGVSLDHFITGFVEYMRKVLINSVNPAVLASVGEELMENDKKIIASFSQNLTAGSIIRMLNILVSAKEGMKSSPIPQLPLELAVFEICGN